MSKKIWLCSLAFGSLVSVSAVAMAVDRTPPVVVEEIIAKVNGEIITRGELAQTRAGIRAEGVKQGLTGQALEDTVNKYSSDALRDQIDQILLVQKGRDLNINVDADVNRWVADMQRTSGLAEADKFQAWVREQSGGESLEDLRLKYKNSLLTRRVVGEEVYRNVSIPKADQLKYYEDHKTEFIRQETVTVREIMISAGDKSPAKVAAAEKKAKDIVERARKNEKFPDLARQYSDAETAKEDGLLGTFPKGQLNKAFEDILFAQKKGYVTDPLRIEPGFEIMKLEDRTVAGQAAFEEVQNEISSRLSEPKVQPKLRALLTQLRQNAFLQIKPGYVDSGAAIGKDTTWKDPAQLKPQTTTKEAVANQRRFKKFLKVVPYGRTGMKNAGDAPPPNVAPIPAAPVKNADGSPSSK